MSESPRILIVTAAFGEGHNSAARNLAVALGSAGAITHVGDPCKLGAPRLTALVSWAYGYVITHLPKVWAAIYRSTDRNDFSRESRVMRPAEDALEEMVDAFRPDAIVSTYPIYPYFLVRIFRKTGRVLPVFTVITDSIEINSSWLRAPTDYWLVTDPATVEAMVGKGLAAAKIVDTGFPVHPEFSRLDPYCASDCCDPFHVLYFPTADAASITRNAAAILDASPHVRLTLVLGRHVRALRSHAREIRAAYPGRVRIFGWTRKIPRLLNSHHLVVGKAGGATVHEAIAARCPMLIHHLVPGQEEGNLALLETLGAGRLAESPAALGAAMRDLLADHAAAWRGMKNALIRHGRNAGAITAATFILHHLSNTHSPSTDPS